MPGGGGPGINIANDRDQDGIPDDIDICPNDSTNKCWRCSWRRLWNCLADAWNAVSYYTGWAFKELLQTADIVLPIPDFNNPWEYKSRLKKYCSEYLGKDSEGKDITVGAWQPGSGDNEAGCLVGGLIFVPAGGGR